MLLAFNSARRPLCRVCRDARRNLVPLLIPKRLYNAPPRFTRRQQQRQVNEIDIIEEDEEEVGFPVHPKPKTNLARVLPRPGHAKEPLTAASFLPPTAPGPFKIARFLARDLQTYAKSDRFTTRLEHYGLKLHLRNQVIEQWVESTKNELEQAEDDHSASLVLAQGDWQWENLSDAFVGEGAGFPSAAESIFHRKFVTFASTHQSLTPATRTHLKAILEITDLTNFAHQGQMLKARSMTRHFHLHIGPTNSGKTYNALKALAQADTGAYAGPLRLLAHEVWERLNLGTVGGLDGKGKPCNLLTGEERRIVDGNAGLSSCTVEMIPLGGPPGGYDVVVIDEIQMMGDPLRGGAWTKAVIGICAKEVHLCGDETTLALLETLIPSLGDKLTVHRYERLTPLQISDESLDGDWNKVEDGDCVVTFSRNKIYAIKKQIESIAAKKCAVIYGALPPETRADQARDFNDENGRCKVLVASDAVGMGLNLKIKRIIFESLEKFNGKDEVPLRLTQIKQIAGRAGRFGMARKTENDDDVNDPLEPDIKAQPGGGVTTLHKGDLPILKDVLPMELPKIRRATMDIPFETRSQLSVLLPPNTPYAQVLDHIKSLAVFPQHMRINDFDQLLPVAEIIEPHKQQLSLGEMDLFTLCPLQRRDPHVLAVFKNMLSSYTTTGLVEIAETFRPTRLLTVLDLVEATLATLPPLPPVIGIGRSILTPPIIVSSLPQLESLHKSLVMYIWLSFRLEVAFPDRHKASHMKERTEKVLDECLARFPGLRNLKTHERPRELDGSVAAWRKQYVAPNGTVKMPGSERKGIKWVEEAVRQRLRNKQVWQSTSLVKGVLKEADGKNLLQVEDEKLPKRLRLNSGDDDSQEEMTGFGSRKEGGDDKD